MSAEKPPEQPMKKKTKKGSLTGRKKGAAVERFLWHGITVSLHQIPVSWPQSGRLLSYARRVAEGREGGQTAAAPIWMAPELEPFFADYSQPFPDPELGAYLFGQLPFRETLILLTDEGKEDGEEWWQEEFLRRSFTDLNRLYLVGRKERKRDASFFEWLYEESGLLAACCERLPETDGRKTAVVELRRRVSPPAARLAPGSLYVDFTSEPKKQRLLCQKRTDISYISARNYLDTAFKTRYNAL